jgi:hypothetical protein
MASRRLRRPEPESLFGPSRRHPSVADDQLLEISRINRNLEPATNGTSQSHQLRGKVVELHEDGFSINPEIQRKIQSNVLNSSSAL